MAMFGCCVHNQPRGEPCGLCPDGKAVIANVSENLALDPTGALAAHRKLAGEATPGPWRLHNMGMQDYDIVCEKTLNYGTFLGLNCGSGAPNVLELDDQKSFDMNAAFIAANSPEKIAALIEVARCADIAIRRYPPGNTLGAALDRLKTAYEKEKR